jgi:hypothetical protein
MKFVLCMKKNWSCPCVSASPAYGYRDTVSDRGDYCSSIVCHSQSGSQVTGEHAQPVSTSGLVLLIAKLLHW